MLFTSFASLRDVGDASVTVFHSVASRFFPFQSRAVQHSQLYAQKILVIPENVLPQKAPLTITGGVLGRSQHLADQSGG